MTSPNTQDRERAPRRRRARWPIAIAVSFLLWAVAATARVVTAPASLQQKPAAEPAKPQPKAAPGTTAPSSPAAPAPKKNRFASIEEEEDDPQAAPQKPAAGATASQTKTAPEKAAAPAAEKKNRLATAEEEPAAPPASDQQKKNRFATVEEEGAAPAASDQQKKPRFAPPDEEDKADPQTPESPYTGTAKCVRCHQKQAKPYFNGPHGKDWISRAPASDLGCETCHGAGLAHDRDPGAKGLIVMPPNMSPRDATALCLKCHDRQHAGWSGSQHDARNLTCVTCHTMHKPKSERGLLKGETIVESCGACHRDKSARLQRSSHMPMREGKMECSTCHDPHGSTNVRMLRAGNTINESCQSCHAEKRGPFLWEHAPVAEKCTTCHDAHGSFNNRMLVAKDPMLCQRCHVATRHPATPYDRAALLARNNRMISRGCINCHQLVHGSNHPSGEFFQR